MEDDLDFFGDQGVGEAQRASTRDREAEERRIRSGSYRRGLEQGREEGLQRGFEQGVLQGWNTTSKVAGATTAARLLGQVEAMSMFLSWKEKLPDEAGSQDKHGDRAAIASLGALAGQIRSELKDSTKSDKLISQTTSVFVTSQDRMQAYNDAIVNLNKEQAKCDE